ncbi:hypothetical protein Ahy_B05g075762 [Arachis hypogaea]|uniref:Zinc knuckle CX2CX4HX4C domain-containing protein n=1 Tax=Arachis hypogaea TaxID=3818 RepID=A0A444Z1X8_ARAHY|nr:hypothetical protein Ahy_B05g075762 [Arachis hypogaea]
MERVLKGNPWAFHNSWLILKKWIRDEEPPEAGLEEAEIKVQIWGLSEHCKTCKLGRKIAAITGEVKDREIYETSRDHIRFIKANVKINIKKPLQKGPNIGSIEDGLLWAKFRYEKLLSFCYYCDLLGHEEVNCEKATKDEIIEKTRAKNLGPWMRDEENGTKVNVASSQKQNKENSETTHHTNIQKRFNDMLLEKLAGLTMTKPNGSVVGKDQDQPPALGHRGTPVEGDLSDTNKKGKNSHFPPLLKVDTTKQTEQNKGKMEHNQEVNKPGEQKQLPLEENTKNGKKLEPMKPKALTEITNKTDDKIKHDTCTWKKKARSAPTVRPLLSGSVGFLPLPFGSRLAFVLTTLCFGEVILAA